MAELGSVLSPRPRARPASWSTTEKRLSGFRFAELLRIRSPERVAEKYGSGGTVMAITSEAMGRAPIRISPNRGSPWVRPATPKGAPLSLTRPTDTLVLTAQVWKAWTIKLCQLAGVGN